MKKRHNLFLDKDVSRWLEQTAAEPGASKSMIVEDALRAFAVHRGAREAEMLLKAPLDRMSRQLDRIESDLEFTLETLALFIRQQFVASATLDRGGAAAEAVGRDRLQSFIDEVAQRVVGGRSLARRIATHAGSQEAAE